MVEIQHTIGSMISKTIESQLGCDLLESREESSRFPLSLTSEERYLTTKYYCNLTKELCVASLKENNLYDPTIDPKVIRRCPLYIIRNLSR